MVMTKITPLAAHSRASQHQKHCREELYKLWSQCPIPAEQLLVNLGMYMRSSSLAKIIFLQEIYLQILDIPGSVMIFGAWWGQDLVVFESLRAIYEPYNYTRRLIAFDTFNGYTSSSDKDKPSAVTAGGNYSTPKNYETYLDSLMSYHQSENAMPHIKKYDIIKGDAVTTTPQFLADHPETLVSLAYFDMALYEPTKTALSAILPRLVKGSVLAFDELNAQEYPGETKAVLETLDLKHCTIKRSKVLPDRTYIIIGDQ
jgi:hypothetical protein